jgi:hypothetical protein
MDAKLWEKYMSEREGICPNCRIVVINSAEAVCGYFVSELLGHSCLISQRPVCRSCSSSAEYRERARKLQEVYEFSVQKTELHEKERAEFALRKQSFTARLVSFLGEFPDESLSQLSRSFELEFESRESLLRSLAESDSLHFRVRAEAKQIKFYLKEKTCILCFCQVKQTWNRLLELSSQFHN